MDDSHQFSANNNTSPEQMGQLQNLDGITSGDIKQNMLVNQANDANRPMNIHPASSVDEDGSNAMAVKTPNSYKYPLLKRYYEFGPWIGRNRKAMCLGCRLQTSSSQPDRLLKHLNKCTALTEEDKISVTELMNERTANKRKKPGQLRLKNDEGEESYYEDDGEPNTSLVNELGLSDMNSGSCGLKKMKREGSRLDKNSQIDEALTKWIMVCSIRLEKIQSKEFLEFARALNPDYRVPSIETIKNVLIPRMLNII